MSLRNIEQKLENYRLQKEKEKKITEYRTWVSSLWGAPSRQLDRLYNYLMPNIHINDDNLENEVFLKSDVSSESNFQLSKEFRATDCDDITEDLVEESWKDRSWLDWAILSLKVSLWFVTWKIFILFEFGVVFFLISAFLFIWINLYSGKRRKGPSAYSVFNHNCEQLPGTFTAEQFERELLHKPL